MAEKGRGGEDHRIFRIRRDVMAKLVATAFIVAGHVLPHPWLGASRSIQQI